MAEKFNKDDVDFGPGMASRHCGKMFDGDRGYCKHFLNRGTSTVRGDGGCELVIGTIQRSKWCRKFERAMDK